MKRNLATLDRNTWQPSMRLIQEAMAHGITNDMIYGGLETGQTSVQGLETAQTTRNCKISTRRVRWDGRVFKYSLATAAIHNIQQGVFFHEGGVNGGGAIVGYTAPLAQVEVGDTTIRIDTGGAAAFAANAFVGGFVMVHTGGLLNHQFRGIVSNTVADGNGYMTITVDYPFTGVITVGMGVEVYANPYASVRNQDIIASYSCVAGLPCTISAAANYYMWLQTWGPCWVNPYGTMGGASVTGERGVVFDGSGNITMATDHRDTNPADDDYQKAGFIIPRTAAAIGSGFIMLQICP